MRLVWLISVLGGLLLSGSQAVAEGKGDNLVFSGRCDGTSYVQEKLVTGRVRHRRAFACDAWLATFAQDEKGSLTLQFVTRNAPDTPILALYGALTPNGPMAMVVSDVEVIPGVERKPSLGLCSIHSHGDAIEGVDCDFAPPADATGPAGHLSFRVRAP